MPTPRKKSGEDLLLLTEEGAGGASPEDELTEALAAIGEDGGAVVKVDRVREGRRPEFVAELPAAGFSLLSIQERFGGGEYVCTVLTGGRKYAGRRTVAIAAPLKPPAPPAAESGGMEKILQAMRDQAQQTQTLMLTLLTRQGNPSSTRRELLQDLLLMKQITGNAAPGFGPEKVLEVLKTGIDFAKDAGGGGEGENIYSLLGKVVENVGQPLAQVLAQAAAQQPAALPHRGPTPKPAPRPAAAPSEPPVLAAPEEVTFMEDDMLGLRAWFDLLIAQADKNADPELYAEVIVDNVPEPMLRNFFAEGDPAAKLAQLDARIGERLEWFRELGQAVQELMPGHAAAAGAERLPEPSPAGGDSARS